MTEDELSLKRRLKLAKATGLLMGAKTVLELGWEEIDRVGLIKLIDEVLELLK